MRKSTLGWKECSLIVGSMNVCVTDLVPSRVPEGKMLVLSSILNVKPEEGFFFGPRNFCECTLPVFLLTKWKTNRPPPTFFLTRRQRILLLSFWWNFEFPFKVESICPSSTNITHSLLEQGVMSWSLRWWLVEIGKVRKYEKNSEKINRIARKLRKTRNFWEKDVENCQIQVQQKNEKN